MMEWAQPRPYDNAQAPTSHRIARGGVWLLGGGAASAGRGAGAPLAQVPGGMRGQRGHVAAHVRLYPPPLAAAQPPQLLPLRQRRQAPAGQPRRSAWAPHGCVRKSAPFMPVTEAQLQALRWLPRHLHLAVMGS